MGGYNHMALILIISHIIAEPSEMGGYNLLMA